MSYTVLIYLPIVSRKNHSCLLQPGIIVNNRSICHGRTRLNPLPVIVGISTGRYFLSRDCLAITGLFSFFGQDEGLLLLAGISCSCPLIADLLPSAAVSAEFPSMSMFSFIRGGGGCETSTGGNYERWHS